MVIKPSTLSSEDAGKEAALAVSEHAARQCRHASRAHAKLALALAATGRREEAISELLNAKTLGGGKAEDYEALAFAAFHLGEHQLSRDCYALVTAMAPSDALAWYNLASSERNIGALTLAYTACEKAIGLDSKLFQAYLLRSQLFPSKPETSHIHELIDCLGANAKSAPAQIFLSYALGKELDDIGDFDRAFMYFSSGASARRQTIRYDVRTDVEKFRRIAEVFNPAAVSRKARAGNSNNYGFIVGLPRSGTTLIERVLTGHPRVRSNGETDNFSTALMRALPAEGADVFDRAARANLETVATLYSSLAGQTESGGVVLEKLPFNYLYLGSIHMALPDAKIILVKRDAVDNCFAMFSTLFGAGYPFSYDLGDLVAYYTAYAALKDHWKGLLPGKVLEVSYEGFVGSPAQHGPPIAAHVGIEWRDRMLSIEDNKTPSATASAAQVRRPIYQSATGRWRNYAKHLSPLVDGLRSAGVAVD